MTIGIYAACAVFVLLFAASVFLVLDYAVSQAMSFNVATERKLVQQEFQHQINEVVKYQADLSYLDATAEQAHASRFTPTFVDRQIKDRLWGELGFSWVVFAEHGKRTFLAVHDGKQVPVEKADNLLFWIDDLLYEANQSYFAALYPVDNGYGLMISENDRDVLADRMPNIQASDMRMVDGKMSIVVVQAVVPHSSFIAKRYSDPRLMVSVKPISDKMLQMMNTRLGVKGLHVVPALSAEENPAAYTPVGKGFTDGPFLVAWTPNSPGPYIWEAALPKVAILTVLAAISLLFVGHRFGYVVHALQKSEASNRFLAKHDALTGLGNRIALDEALKRVIDRDSLQPFAVLAIDLDLFKSVNDRHGHSAGDIVLKTVAARFRERIGSRGFIARQGGDEFIALIEDARDQGEVMSIAAGLVVDAQVPVQFNDTLVRIGGSAGVAIFPDHGLIVRDLVHAADTALYAAKNGGRNRAVLYDPEEQKPTIAV